MDLKHAAKSRWAYTWYSSTSVGPSDVAGRMRRKLADWPAIGASSYLTIFWVFASPWIPGCIYWNEGRSKANLTPKLKLLGPADWLVGQLPRLSR